MRKYRNTPTVLDGIRFDSKREAERYAELKLLERGGIIKDLKTQVRFELIPKNKNGRAVYYVCDFTYTENGVLVVEDVKSQPTKTPVYRLKKRLMKGPRDDIRIYKNGC